jgi:hypothetical protein
MYVSMCWEWGVAMRGTRSIGARRDKGEGTEEEVERYRATDGHLDADWMDADYCSAQF